MFAEPDSGAGPRWDTNVEGSTTYDIRIDGRAAAGRAELVEIPRAVDAPSEGGFPGVVPEAISGVMTWMCEAPRGELTPIEGRPRSGPPVLRIGAGGAGALVHGRLVGAGVQPHRHDHRDEDGQVVEEMELGSWHELLDDARRHR